MRFLIGFLTGLAVGFVMAALFAGEDNPLALITGESASDGQP